MMRPSEKVTTEERAQLRHILQPCPTLRTLNELVSDFAGMARQRHGQHLSTWAATDQASGISHLHRFADGLLNDYDAVRAGLTLPWSNGAAEGTPRRSKRSNYGAASYWGHNGLQDHGMCARAPKLTP
jgi:transposase